MSIASRITAIEGHITDDYNALEGIGADLTNVDKNIENIKNVLADIYDEMPKVSESDVESASLSPTRKGAMSIKYKGDTQQDSTTGKNLLPVALSTSTQGNITCTVNKDKSITISGSNTYQTNFGVGTITLPAGTYKATLGLSSGVSTSTYYIRLGKGGPVSAPFILNVGAGDNNVFTLTEETEVGANIIVKENVSTNITMKPMIRLSSIADDTYEPYTNGASPNPDYPQPIHNVSGDNTIEICGKNLFDIPNGTGTRGNNTFTANNQQITLNSATSGTESAFYLNDVSQVSQYASSSYSNARDYNMTTTGGTYTLTTYFSAKPSSVFQIYLFTNKKMIMKRTDNSSHWEDGKLVFNIILDDDEYIKSVQAYMNSSNVFDNLIITAQLEKSSQATTYEAYTGNSQLISLGVENLLDLTNGTYSNNGIDYIVNNGEITINGTASAYSSVEIPLTNYDIIGTTTLSLQNISGTLTDLSTTLTCYLQLLKGATVVKEIKPKYSQINTSTKTETTIITKLKLSASSGVAFNNYKFNIQLEKGTKANSYSPYGASYIELNKISTYQDYIYKDNDRWFLHKEIGKKILNGSEDWQGASSPTGTARFYYNDTTYYNGGLQNINVFALSSKFKGINWADMYSGDTTTKNAISLYNSQGQDLQGRLHIRIDNTYASSVSTFKTWLSTHNTEVKYVLATSTDTEITDTTLLEQLETIKRSYDGVTNISQENNDLPFILDVSALKEWE